MHATRTLRRRGRCSWHAFSRWTRWLVTTRRSCPAPRRSLPSSRGCATHERCCGRHARPWGSKPDTVPGFRCVTQEFLRRKSTTEAVYRQVQRPGPSSHELGLRMGHHRLLPTSAHPHHLNRCRVGLDVSVDGTHLLKMLFSLSCRDLSQT